MLASIALNPSGPPFPLDPEVRDARAVLRRVNPTIAVLVLAFGAGLGAVPPVFADPPPASEPEPEPEPDSEVKAQAETEAPRAATVVRGLSWDIVSGGVPKSGALAQIQLGFPGLLEAAYHYTLAPGFSVGGLVAFDYGYYKPKDAFDAGLIFAVPVRYTLFRRDTVSAGVRLQPGIHLAFDNLFRFGILANVGGVIAWTLENRFVVGGGIDIPLAFVIPEKGTAAVAIPLLFGPVFEMHLSPPLAITLDVKVGPHISTVFDTSFALKLMVGAAYRL